LSWDIPQTIANSEEIKSTDHNDIFYLSWAFPKKIEAMESAEEKLFVKSFSTKKMKSASWSSSLDKEENKRNKICNSCGQ
jgi:hypothetical protein